MTPPILSAEAFHDQTLSKVYGTIKDSQRHEIMKHETVCVLGGSGFVGRHLVAKLANEERQVKVLTRHRERHRELLVMPRVELIEANALDPMVLREQFAGCDAVVNLIGILNGTEQQFRAIHAELPAQVAEACVGNRVPRLLHMSALNADVEGPSIYLRTKGEGQAAVHAFAERGLNVTSFRPSVIFGPDDSFFNRFALLLKLSPVIPLACPNARFAPVYIEDVVRAFAGSLDDETTFGKGYELCGPDIYTLKELVELTARLIGRRRLVLGLNDNLSRLQGKVFERLPGQPFTTDNYHSMQRDSVCRENGLRKLGISSTSIDSVMPRHFGGGNDKSLRYSQIRRLSRR
jgi:NADH dehydrogenase